MTMFFFFSSRRRHTRWNCDWSSDVCSSDLGFLDPTGRARDREGGAYYARAWDRAIAAGRHMVLIDTWNYFAEGSAIAPTREYGRQYLDITRAKAAIFHAGR